jgi:hypothetical protein
MKPNLVLVALFLGLLLTFAPVGVKSQGTPRQISVINSTPHSRFVVGFNGTVPFTNGTASYNLVGTGGSDNFSIFGNETRSPMNLLATTLKNNTFFLLTGNSSSSFSFSTGDNSTFRIIDQNYGNGTQSIVISGGARCNVTESSLAPINGTDIWSISLGTNSSVSMGSAFIGNNTAINIVL